jgi:hypothetical protein
VRYGATYPAASLAAMALRWVGAVLLVGGIVVAFGVLPWAGLGLALAGAGILFLLRSPEDGGGGAAG